MQQPGPAWRGVCGTPDAMSPCPSHNRCPDSQDRKIVSAIFKHLVHNDVKSFGTTFIGRDNIDVVDELVDMYGNTVVALLAGSMVRECIRIESVTDHLLRDGRSLRKMFEECVLVGGSTCGGSGGGGRRGIAQRVARRRVWCAWCRMGCAQAARCAQAACGARCGATPTPNAFTVRAANAQVCAQHAVRGVK